jgi:hypothetical protein
MASYINNGAAIEFPFLKDTDGNVLVVKAGETFDAPEGLVVAGIEPVKAAKAKGETNG